MISPQLSPEQRAEADRIFKSGVISTACLGLVAVVSCRLLVDYIGRTLHHEFDTSWIFTFGFLLIYVLSNKMGSWQVRRAGLSQERVERHTIPKTAQQFLGEPLQIRSKSTIKDGWVSVVFLSAALAVGIWLQTSGRGFHPVLAAVCFLALGGFLRQSLIHLSNPPLFRLDVNGVFNGTQHLWSQRISWAKIKDAQWQQVFDYKGENTMRMLVFRNYKGRPAVTVFLGKDTVTEYSDDELVHQVEARLCGDS